MYQFEPCGPAADLREVKSLAVNLSCGLDALGRQARRQGETGPPAWRRPAEGGG